MTALHSSNDLPSLRNQNVKPNISLYLQSYGTNFSCCIASLQFNAVGNQTLHVKFSALFSFLVDDVQNPPLTYTTIQHTIYLASTKCNFKNTIHWQDYGQYIKLINHSGANGHPH